jgi:adenylate cyclase
VAVMPFADLSEKRDQQYFADGLTEEIIDLLTRVPGLRVPARTSSFYFRDKNATIPEIAQTLHVSTVLEGSVRKSGDRLRVTAQLVRGDTGAHLWSQTFERDAKDVFRLQTDIATAVAGLMSESLQAVRGAAGSKTENEEAYSSFVEGRFHAHAGTEEEMKVSARLFERAVSLDPKFAEAWAALSAARLAPYLSGWSRSEPACAKARDAARRAIGLDPRLLHGYGNLVWVILSCDWDWPAARAQIAVMTRIDPSDTDTLYTRAYYQQVAGDLAAAEHLWKEILVADPMNPVTYGNLAGVQAALGHYRDAEESTRRAQALNPAAEGFHGYVAQLQAFAGEFSKASATLQQETDQETHLESLALLQYLQGHREAGKATTAQVSKAYGEKSALTVAEIYAIGGYRDQAFKWLNSAVERHERDVVFLKGDPYFHALHQDPRFQAVVAKLRLPEPTDLN